MVETCWEAVKEAVTELGGVVSTRQVIDYINEKYPNQWKKSTIRAHMIGCSVNHSSSHHYPSFPKFLYTVGPGRVRLYNPEQDGNWIVDHRGARIVTEDEGEEEPEEREYPPFEEATISLERDLESFIFDNLGILEEGLKAYEGEAARQYSVRSGRIDVLAQDKDGKFVVIELKIGTARASALTQVLAYMANIADDIANRESVRGIIVAYDFIKKLVDAASFLPNIKLMQYRATFQFKEI